MKRETIEEFKQRGGKIKQCPKGKSNYVDNRFKKKIFISKQAEEKSFLRKKELKTP